MVAAGAVSAVVHVVTAAVWLGAMAYSFAVLHPRAATFFGSDGQGFETLMTLLAAGARWKVLGACALLGLTGVGLVVARMAATTTPSTTWTVLIVFKVALFAATVGVFCYVTWRMWPARVFAAADEVSHHQRRFRVVAATLLILVCTQVVLGVVAARVG